MSDDRTPAERVTLGVSTLVLAAVVGLIAFQLPGQDVPPLPSANVVEIRSVDERFHVVVDVTNDGGQTAANVQVTGELEIAGEVSSGEQTIDFLAGDEHMRLTFVFDDDPEDGDLTVGVSSFTVP
ncbi:MAG: TIGR02588 family protein [Acidimicrobiia bacterium]|nr:TIGR02588 family protein [Acidimicrobiia bacterium]